MFLRNSAYLIWAYAAYNIHCRHHMASNDPLATKESDPEAVDAYMQKLKHPLADLAAALRSTILAPDKRIGEEIKWNAPAFFSMGPMERFDEGLTNTNVGLTVMVHCLRCGGEVVQRPPVRLLLVGLTMLASIGLAYLWPLLWIPAIFLGIAGTYLVVWALVGRGRWCRGCKRFDGVQA